MQETEEMQVQFLGWEDPLEKEMANCSSILGCKIPWRSLVGYSPWDGRVRSNGDSEHTHPVINIPINPPSAPPCVRLSGP